MLFIKKGLKNLEIYDWTKYGWNYKNTKSSYHL